MPPAHSARGGYRKVFRCRHRASPLQRPRLTPIFAPMLWPRPTTPHGVNGVLPQKYRPPGPPPTPITGVSTLPILEFHSSTHPFTSAAASCPVREGRNRKVDADRTRRCQDREQRFVEMPRPAISCAYSIDYSLPIACVIASLPDVCCPLPLPYRDSLRPRSFRRSGEVRGGSAGGLSASSTTEEER